MLSVQVWLVEPVLIVLKLMAHLMYEWLVEPLKILKLMKVLMLVAMEVHLGLFDVIPPCEPPLSWRKAAYRN